MILLGIMLSLGIFAAGSVANEDSVLGAIAPDAAAACGTTNLDAVLEDGSAGVAAPDVATPYANSAVRVHITACTGSTIWQRYYKYNAFGEVETSVYWTYLGGATGGAATTCDYIANSRTSHRGYFYRATATNCATNPAVQAYLPSTYGQGWNSGWIKNVSCTTYAAAPTTYVNTDKPHTGCDGSAVGFNPFPTNAIFYDNVAPTAPTWTLGANANAYKSGNTVYFRKVANTFTVTATHTEIASSTKSGANSYSWGGLSATTGWSGYASGTVTTTGTSAKSFTSSATSVNATVNFDSNDLAGNDGTDATITLTADTSLPTMAWVAPTTFDQQSASSYTFDWTEADTGSGVKTRNVTLQTAPATSGTCGTFSTTSTLNSHSTSSYDRTGMVSGNCYRVGVAVVDNVSNTSTISYSQAILVDTNVPTASIAVDAANTSVYRDGNTVYYRSGTAGNVNITVTGTDNISGFQDQRFNVSGGTTTGWSPTAATSYVTTNPYTRNYAWTANATGVPTISGHVRNNAALGANTSTLTMTPDATAPGLGFNYPSGPNIYTSDPTFTVDFNITENGSGFDAASAGWNLQRQRAPVTDGACGTYVNDGSPVTGDTPGLDQVSEQTGLAHGYCYKWQLSATDSVGNAASFNTFTTVIMDETAPEDTDINATGTNVFANGDTIYFNPASGGSLNLTGTASDPEVGIDTVTFGELTSDTLGNWNPILAETKTATAGAATKTYTWTTNAAAANLSVDAVNEAGITTQPVAVTFEPDANVPSALSFIAPVASTLQSDTSYEFSWAGYDAESGINDYQSILERTAATGGSCGTSWNNVTDYGRSVIENRNATGLADGYCYRMAVRGYDNVGNVTSFAYSSSVLIDTTAPGVSFTYSDSSNNNTSPFARGDLLITATFTETLAATPQLSIERNGSAVVSSQLMTATGNPLVYTYTYNITDDGDYALFVTASDLAGNNMLQPSGGQGTFAVTQQEQTITFGALADKTYGDAAFTVSATASSGLPVSFSADGDCTVLGDEVTITGAGSCAITASQAGDGEYLAAPDVERTFAVSKATATVTANNATRTYGENNPTFTVTISNFVNGDTLGTSGITGTANLTTTATSASGVGIYPINAAVGTLASDNYNFTFVAGELSITPASLTVTADNKTRTYNTANPSLTVSYSGFANGEALGTSDITGAPSLTTTAITSSPAGTYPITASAGSLDSDNYAFTFVSGTLTINKAAQTITFPTISDKTYGDPSFAAGATASSGLTVTYNSSGDCGVNGSGAISITGAGDCTITAIQAGNANYLPATNVARSFNIAKATPVITWANPAAINYGTVLSGSQLNATTTTAGTFTYTPPAGTLLEAGTHPLSVSFVASNTDNYNNANKTAQITVNTTSAPLESGLRNWTFADQDPRFDNGVTVVNDPTAPSGDGKVALLTVASGQKTALSESVTVIGGEEVTVWGDWRLSGHGTRLRLCFDVGGCTASATVGNLTGSTIYSIDWITFELSSVVPAGATEAWLSWTVGSDSYSDGFSWNVLADDATGVTRVEVSPTITVTAPATINFGVGLPGDVLDHEDIAVNVVTNNTTGYDLSAAGTDLDGSGSDSIAMSQIELGPANGALTSFTGENAPMSLASASERTEAAGDDYAFDARLTLPFVGSGLYQGTLTFTAVIH